MISEYFFVFLLTILQESLYDSSYTAAEFFGDNCSTAISTAAASIGGVNSGCIYSISNISNTQSQHNVSTSQKIILSFNLLQ